MSKFSKGDKVKLTGSHWGSHGLRDAVVEVLGVAGDGNKLARIARADDNRKYWFIHEDGDFMEEAWGAELVSAASDTLRPWEFGLGRVGNYAIYNAWGQPGDIDQTIRVVNLENGVALRIRRYPFETNSRIETSAKRAASYTAAKAYFDATPRISPSANAQVGEVWGVRRHGVEDATIHMVITGQLGISFVDSAGTTFPVDDTSIEYARKREVR